MRVKFEFRKTTGGNNDKQSFAQNRFSNEMIFRRFQINNNNTTPTTSNGGFEEKGADNRRYNDSNFWIFS